MILFFNTARCAAATKFRLAPLRKCRWFGLLVGSLAVLISSAAAENVTLEWDANTEPDIAGYKLYFGTASGAYSNSIDTGSSTSATVADLVAGSTYFFAVTAYNTEGLESLTSSEVIHTVGTGNHAPAATNQSATAVEDQSRSITLSGSDIDGDALTFLIVNPPVHGTLSGIPPAVLYTPAANYNGPDSFSFAASDGTLTSSPATVAVSVTAVNDAPVAAGQSVVTQEDTGARVDLAATDVDGGGLTYSIVQPPVHGTLQGSLPNPTYSPNPDFHGSDGFSFCASDGAMVSAPASVPITVLPVNDAPTLSTFASQTIEEGSSTGALAFTVGDTETSAGSLAVTGTSSNTSLVPQAGIVFGGSGASRTVTVTPAAGQNGTATISLIVSDGALTRTGTFFLTVNGVNDVPTLSTVASQTIDEDSSTGTLAFTVGDTETTAGNLTVTGSSSNTSLVPHASIVFGGSGANRTVSVTPASNQNGSATISLTVSDGALTATGAFLLTVQSVNDAPTLSSIASQTIDEDSSTGALAFTVGDTETAAGSLTVTGGSSNTALVPSAGIVFGGSGASRTVSVTPAANQNGTATISLTVSDGALTRTNAFLLTVNAVTPAALWEIVALSGDAAPGAGGARFSSFVSGVRSDADGHAAFRANLNSASGSAGGVWVEANGLLELAARQGSAAPGVAGGLFGAFATNPWWSGSGNLLLHVKLLTGPGGVTSSTDGGLWYKSPSGPLQLVARENDQAPGLGTGAKLLEVGSNAALGHDGRYAFTATLRTNSALGITSANDSGLWTNLSGPLAPLVREGAAAPGTTNGAQFDLFTGALVSANSCGQIAFRTVLKSTTGVKTANKYGIWMWDGVRLGKVARGGEPAPGTPTGAVFAQPKAPLLRDSMLVFYSTLATSGGVSSSNDTGFWILENGAVTLLAREGSAAPGAPAGAVFNSLLEPLAGNDQGDIIFMATLRTGTGVSSSNNGGIWARSPATADTLTLIAREGSHAPQTPAGAVFTTFSTALVSGGGREAFTANLLAGTGGVTTANDRGLWMRSATGELALLLREGDKIPVSPTDLRVVADITLDKSSEVGAAGFSGGDSIKIVVTFTNGSAAIMSCEAP